MVEAELLLTLSEFVREAVKDYRLPVKNGDPRPPQVVPGFLPPKRGSEHDDFPFVIVRPVKGSCDETASATVNLIVGVYDESVKGFEHCLNIMTRLRTAVCEKGVVANRYQLTRPITWELPEEQPYPQWLLLMTTEWAFYAPIEKYDEGFYDD